MISWSHNYFFVAEVVRLWTIWLKGAERPKSHDFGYTSQLSRSDKNIFAGSSIELRQRGRRDCLTMTLCLFVGRLKGDGL